MMKLHALIAMAIIECNAATIAVAAPEAHEPNDILPLLEKSKQTRSSAAHTRLCALPTVENSREKIALEKTIVYLTDINIPQRILQKKAAQAEPAASEANLAPPPAQPPSELSSNGRLDRKAIEELIALSKDPNYRRTAGPCQNDR
ncbi:MAG: hypothetical protein Q7T18_10840 [Sedimentisphaerales bacterium]|nr:hypothetical protein [Sedimentisphaerales bacterium]